jgi:hypothetical protein
MNVKVGRNQNGVFEAECIDLEAWEDGDRLIRYLKSEFSARVAERIDGPDARRWFVTVNTQRFTVDQSDLGFLSFATVDAENADAEATVRRVAEQLQKLSPVEWIRLTESTMGRLTRTFKGKARET